MLGGGGLIGGVSPNGGDTGSYEGAFPNFVAWNGKLWYLTSELPPSTTVGVVPTDQAVLNCIDALTGQLVWKKTLPGRGATSLQLELQAEQKIDPRQAERPTNIQDLWVIGNGLRRVNPFTGECNYYNSTFTPTMYYNHAFYRISTNSTTGESWALKWDIGSMQEVWQIPMGKEYRTGDYIDITQDPPVLVRFPEGPPLILTGVLKWMQSTLGEDR